MGQSALYSMYIGQQMVMIHAGALHLAELPIQHCHVITRAALISPPDRPCLHLQV